MSKNTNDLLPGMQVHLKKGYMKKLLGLISIIPPCTPMSASISGLVFLHLHVPWSDTNTDFFPGFLQLEHIEMLTVNAGRSC